MIFFKHQLAVLPAMAAAGDAFEEMFIGATAAENGTVGGRGTDVAPEAAATLGNSYVEDLSKLGIRDVRVPHPHPSAPLYDDALVGQPRLPAPQQAAWSLCDLRVDRMVRARPRFEGQGLVLG